MRARRGRAALLLTTHSMEEADQLADDIMIMVRALSLCKLCNTHTSG